MLLTDIFAVKAAFEQGCLAFCLWAVMVMAGVSLLCASGALRDVVGRWTRLGKFDRLVILCGLSLATMVGATKNSWSRVPNGGADTISGTTLVGIYRALSNDVQEVGGVTTTNKIPMIRVAWTGNGITTATPVQYRYADTNYWTAATKSNLASGADGTTNWMEFVTTYAIYSMNNWWVGTDTPAVVITSSGITITGFSANGNGVTVTWTCEDPRATTFRVWRKKATDSDWTACGDEVSGNSTTVTGFFLDAEWIWRVTADFLEDGE